MLLREECPRCRTRSEEWVDEKGYPLEEPVWIAVPRHCHGCDDLERIENGIPQKQRGAYATLVPFDQYDPDSDRVLDPRELGRPIEVPSA